MIFFFFAVCVAWHVFATVLYVGPKNVFKQKLQVIVEDYMEPIFYQSWHLFSPNPGISSISLWVNCDSKTEDWFDSTEDLQEEHNAYRVTSAGKLLYVYRALASDLYHEVKDIIRDDCETSTQKCIDDSILKCKTTTEYERAIVYANRLCKAKGKALDSAPVLRLSRFWPLQYSDIEEERESSSPWSKVETFKID